ncbi:hypothetical protein AB6A23_11100 [Paenibacillus tarimensis]
MGLDCSHDAFHGAYSSFNRLRQFVCKSIGGSYPPHETEGLEPEAWYFGEGYNKEKNPGLYEFFCHSDCDGEISPEMCSLVANELESILPLLKKLEEITEAYGHILFNGGYVGTVEKFIAGCRKAAELNEPLLFS